ncbi:stalk domain-containing protein [Paenibacillus lactis]|uniref:Copper amine oxidase-like N-terminal domain-containing protein n=1 Tax=Paenibacillus lactis 154 TaxID=743719 RepID=G4HNW7_9BACL|nr:stalk domain-containing protein [Paenibacillus lactis]EHB50131.1 hypothetical protein PaelaDRAFT_5678 [Paenibacillus lactis 154]
MKKWACLFGGIIIGAMVATSGSTIAAQVKSLVGQKVTGEYKVVVNGKELQDKGAVIGGRTNAPVRAISDSIGAELKVDNKTKTITIVTENSSDVSSSSEENKGNEAQATPLIERKKFLEEEIQKLEQLKKHDEEQLALLQEGLPKDLLKDSLNSINKQISEKTQELSKINAELEALNK